MAEVRSMGVFCGASTGKDGAHQAAARRLGALMGERGIRLVFGGGHVGMMGVVADAVMGAGGEAVGVIPSYLMERELGHKGITELHVVDSMHSRKQKMFELADAFTVLAGGFGTMDETFELITWKQLGMHDKPIVLLDSGGYWAPFVALAEAIVEGGFARRSYLDLFTLADTADEVFAALERLPPARIRADAARL